MIVLFADNTEEMAQNKLLLLYIIKKSPYNFSKHQLNEFILEKAYMNYFYLQQYLSELVDSELIEISIIDDEPRYVISEKGDLALNYFDGKIPEKMKLELAEEFQTHKSMKKRETQVLSEYFPKEDNQYMVNLKLVENDDTLFSLYIDVPSIEQAKIVCKTWEEKTDSIYMNIMNMFID